MFALEETKKSLTKWHLTSLPRPLTFLDMISLCEGKLLVSGRQRGIRIQFNTRGSRSFKFMDHF